MLTNVAAAPDLLRGLRLRWLVVFLFSLLGIGAGALYLSASWNAAVGVRWSILASVASLYLLWVFYKNLPYNQQAATGELYPDLGLPNLLTYWRGFLVALTAGFLLVPRPQGELAWLPGLLYSLGILPDFLDGYLARVTRRSTRLGETLDVAVDSVAVLTGTVLAVVWGQLPVWYLLVGLARYLYLFGIWLRRQMDKPVFDLPPSMGRRALAGAQMGFMMVMLWPLFGPPGTTIAAFLFGVPFLLNFIKDFLYASGVLRTDLEKNRGSRAAHMAAWLAVFLRLVVMVGLGSIALGWWSDFPTQANILASLGAGLPVLLAGLILLLESFVILCMAAGTMVRTVSILAVCLVGYHLQMGEMSLVAGIVVASAAGLLLYLGSGRLSLWAPEEEMLQRRAGEESSDAA
jgi:CDP-diacylglycerol---glycerol-3-phosphate 3-phosphatidyltransferase